MIISPEQFDILKAVTSDTAEHELIQRRENIPVTGGKQFVFRVQF